MSKVLIIGAGGVSGVVVHKIGFFTFKDGIQGFITDVLFVKDHPGIKVPPPSGRKIVHHHNPMPRFKISVCNMRADKAGATGDQNSHFLILAVLIVFQDFYIARVDLQAHSLAQDIDLKVHLIKLVVALHHTGHAFEGTLGDFHFQAL